MAINPRIKQKAEDIRKKIFGTEVRESLASGIEAISEDVEATKERQITVEETMQTVIDETTGKDVISAPEIIAAHVDSNGTAHPNLKSRLDNFEVSATQQLQQTMTQEEFDGWVATILDGGPSIFFDTLTALQTEYPSGSAGVALVRETDPAKIYVWNGTIWQDFGPYQGIEVKDGTVTPEKLLDVTKIPTTVNLFDKKDLIKDGYYSEDTGLWVSSIEYYSSNHITIAPRKKYRNSAGWTLYAFWDEIGSFISGAGNSYGFTAPHNAKTVTFSIPKGKEATLVFSEESQYSTSYIPYVAGYLLGSTWTKQNNSQSPLTLLDVSEKPASINLFNNKTILKDGFFKKEDGVWLSSAEFDSSDYIPIEEGQDYRKQEFWSEFAFWAGDKKTFITGFGDNYGFTTPEGAKYVTFSIPKEKTGTLMLTKTSNWIGGVEWGGAYVPYKEGYSFGESWIIEKTEGIQRHRDTSDLFLRVPTPYNDGSQDEWANHQATHPSVVQFEEPWNGFKYWMAFTPYPHNQEALENPCVIGSNDGIKWVQPKGFVNPLYPKPVDGYNSDTHLFYNLATGKLEMWWREVTRSPLPHNETLIRRTTSDGVTWSEPEAMINVSHPSWELDLVAPSIMFQNGLYKMWFMRQGSTFHHHLMYMTSPDGKTWSDPVNVKSNGSNIVTWHTNVVLHDGVLHLFNHDNVQGKSIKYATSTLGAETEFTTQKTIIQGTNVPWALDGGSLYRATPIFTDYGFMVIYGAKSQQGDYTLKIQSGANFDSLTPVPAKAFDFYNAW